MIYDSWIPLERSQLHLSSNYDAEGRNDLLHDQTNVPLVVEAQS
jgi:RNA:NAD 2'-phosphotransferase (TPT1/KptA family)